MMRDKKILAIETSGELCSVSLSLEYNKYDERNILMKHIHSEKLIPMINEIMISNKISSKELDCIAVSIGPGSFTGLRIGMTASKGIAFASNLPIVPVPTFDALSLEISEFVPDGSIFCIVNNANIEECYYAKYKSESNVQVVLKEASLIKKIDINSMMSSSDLIFGNLNINMDIRNVCFPHASSVAKWAYLFGKDFLTFDYDYLEPNYLKKFKVKDKK